VKCEGKIPHATRDEALDHVKRLVYKHHLAGEDHRSVGLTPYPCDCGSWHVGHAEQTPPVWHYTTMDTLDAILAADELRPHKPLKPPRSVTRLGQKARVIARMLREERPLLWFSRNPKWEYSVDKLDVERTSGRALVEVAGGGLLRFGVPAAFAKLRWADYIARNPMPKFIRDAMIARGDPAEWLATDEAVSMRHVRSIEVYMYRWMPVAEAADVFDAYIARRSAEYREASLSLAVKMGEAQPTSKDGWIEMSLNEAELILMQDFLAVRKTRGTGNPAALREMLSDWRR